MCCVKTACHGRRVTVGTLILWWHQQSTLILESKHVRQGPFFRLTLSWRQNPHRAAEAAAPLSFAHLARLQWNCPDVMPRPLVFRRPPTGAACQIKHVTFIFIENAPALTQFLAGRAWITLGLCVEAGGNWGNKQPVMGQTWWNVICGCNVQPVIVCNLRTLSFSLFQTWVSSGEADQPLSGRWVVPCPALV